jgi:hypothetical protein
VAASATEVPGHSIHARDEVFRDFDRQESHKIAKLMLGKPGHNPYASTRGT